MIRTMDDDQKDSDERDEPYIRWIENLPRYYVEGNTIFVHAGIEEDAGDLWDWATGENIFTGKFPAQTGKIEGLDKKVVAGHIGTSDIAGDASFHDIYYDGASHYYIDGTCAEKPQNSCIDGGYKDRSVLSGDRERQLAGSAL